MDSEQPLDDTTEKPVTKKSTQAEIETRVTEIYELMIGGASRTEMFRYGSETWGISSRQVEDYLKTAREKLATQLDKNRDANLSLAVERLTTIFRKTMKVQDYQRAIAAQRELNLLLGLYAPTKQDINIHHTWQDEAVSLIKAGEITYEAALETFDHDDALVRELFAKAQVEISTGQSEAD